MTRFNLIVKKKKKTSIRTFVTATKTLNLQCLERYGKISKLFRFQTYNWNISIWIEPCSALISILFSHHKGNTFERWWRRWWRSRWWRYWRATCSEQRWWWRNSAEWKVNLLSIKISVCDQKLYHNSDKGSEIINNSNLKLQAWPG